MTSVGSGVREIRIHVLGEWRVIYVTKLADAIGTRAMWRKPDILVECVLRLVRKDPSAPTGQTLLDEDFLRAEGVTDFSGYACVPGVEPTRIAWNHVQTGPM